MIKNKIKLLQLFCLLYAGQFASMMDEVITNIENGGPMCNSREVSKKFERDFKDIARQMTHLEYCAYIEETAEMKGFEEKIQRLYAAQPPQDTAPIPGDEFQFYTKILLELSAESIEKCEIFKEQG